MMRVRAAAAGGGLVVLAAAAFLGCRGEFAVDVTVTRALVVVPARVTLDVTELDALGGTSLFSTTIDTPGAEFFAAEGQSNRLLVAPSPEARAVRVVARALDAGGAVVATDEVEVERRRGVVAATLVLGGADTTDAGTDGGGPGVDGGPGSDAGGNDAGGDDGGATDAGLDAAGTDAGLDAGGADAGGPPTVPILRLPMNGAYLGSIYVSGSLRPTFVWEPATDPTGGSITYDVQAAQDATFASVEFTSAGVGTTAQPAVDLPVSSSAPVGARYYWRVRACGGGGCSAWSAAWWVNVGRAERDCNGDGYADLLVSRPNADVGGTDRGSVELMWGSPAPLVGTVGAYYGVADGEGFGRSMAWAGDLDADGRGDFLLAHPGVYPTTPGSVWVYLCTSSAAPSSTATLATGSSSDVFAGSVAGAGDLNGDGYDDVVVGATSAGVALGQAFVYFGGPGAFDATADAVLTGEVASDGFGKRVATAGDADGDGYADLLVAAPEYGSGFSYTGRIYLYLGGPSAFDTAADLLITGTIFDFLGEVMGPAGDMNGDGYADFVVSSTIGGGEVQFHFGESSVPDDVAEAVIAGLSGTGFGSALDHGDFNADGFDDVAVGAPACCVSPVDVGRAYVYYGGAGAAPDTAADGLIVGVLDWRLGAAVATGDLDGDGYDDLVVGESRNSTYAPDGGGFHVHRGVAGSTFDTFSDYSTADVVASNYWGAYIAVGP